MALWDAKTNTLNSSSGLIKLRLGNCARKRKSKGSKDVLFCERKNKWRPTHFLGLTFSAWTNLFSRGLDLDSNWAYFGGTMDQWFVLFPHRKEALVRFSGSDPGAFGAEFGYFLCGFSLGTLGFFPEQCLFGCLQAQTSLTKDICDLNSIRLK